MNAFNTSTALVALLSAAGLAWAAADTPPNPYTGQEARAIKSLSAQEVAALLVGHGAGFAKAAELNGYPGPVHVLELAAPLRLDAAQLDATRHLMVEHKERASRLGAELVSSERALDALFAQKQADPAAVQTATLRVGVQQARLRAEHLSTHLTQTGLLSDEQVRRYSELRGYAGNPTEALRSTHTTSDETNRHRH